MEKKTSRPVRSTKQNQAPIDENPLAIPEKSKKDLTMKKAKSKTMKDDKWTI